MTLLDLRPDDVGNAVRSVTDRMPPIGLDDLVTRAELLTRVDAKYLLPVTDLPELLGDLADSGAARVLQIDGCRTSRYRSVYFDTPGLASFHAAAPTRRHRYKVRVRSYLVVDGGTVDVTASVEGLEAVDITVAGGTTSIVASDDGVNAAGGDDTSGGDPGTGVGPGGGEAVGDYSLMISGGTVVVDGPTQSMNGALDVNGTFQISGGVLLATGSAGMAVAPDQDSPQGRLSATLDSQIEPGTTVHVVDADGTVLASFVAPKALQNVVYSAAEVTSGSAYRVFTGGTATGTGVGSLAESGDLGGATEVATVTAGEAPAGGSRRVRR